MISQCCSLAEQCTPFPKAHQSRLEDCLLSLFLLSLQSFLYSALCLLSYRINLVAKDKVIVYSFSFVGKAWCIWWGRVIGSAP